MDGDGEREHRSISGCGPALAVAHTAKCQECGRTRYFRSAEAAANAAPAGRICRARIRQAAAGAQNAIKPDQYAKAIELIEDGGIVRTSRDGMFAATASDGTTVYVVDVTHQTCGCKAGQHGRYCYHLAAAQILTEAAAIRRRAA